MRANSALLKGLVVAFAVLLAFSLGAVYASYTMNVSIPVTVEQPALIVSAAIDGQSCAVSTGGLAALCPSQSIEIGGMSILVVVVRNHSLGTIYPKVLVTSSNFTVATVGPLKGNPIFIGSGREGVYDFGVTGKEAGFTNITVSISGA